MRERLFGNLEPAERFMNGGLRTGVFAAFPGVTGLAYQEEIMGSEPVW